MGEGLLNTRLYLKGLHQDHSQDMVKFNFFSHKSPVNKKRSFSDRLDHVGIKYSHAG